MFVGDPYEMAMQLCRIFSRHDVRSPTILMEDRSFERFRVAILSDPRMRQQNVFAAGDDGLADLTGNVLQINGLRFERQR